MASADNYPLCTICGGCITAQLQNDRHDTGVATWRPTTWTGNAILLEGPRWPQYREEAKSMDVQSVPDDAVKRHIAVAMHGRGDMMVIPCGRIIEPQTVSFDNEDDYYYHDAYRCWFFGIHAACEDIAIRFMQTSPQAHIKSLGDLWMTLDLRCSATPWFTNGEVRKKFLPALPENPLGKQGEEDEELGVSRYYVPPWFKRPLRGWWTHDPLHIPGLAASLLCNIEEFKSVGATSMKFMKTFEKLPEEIKGMILSLLLSEDLSLECNYLMPQCQWRQLFLQIPFLWDLSDEIMKEKTPSTDLENQQWNWEKISRQVLASPTVAKLDKNRYITWDYQDVGLEVAHGLRNRRRIWQILQDMHPNDVGFSCMGMEYPEDPGPFNETDAWNDKPDCLYW